MPDATVNPTHYGDPAGGCADGESQTGGHAGDPPPADKHWLCAADCYKAKGGVAQCPTDKPPGVANATIACLGEGGGYSGVCLLECIPGADDCGPMICVNATQTPFKASICMWKK
jgi:hypothetical protein